MKIDWIIGCVFAGLLLYLFVFQLLAIWSFTIDDMYITLRYAKHWAQGDGLLWNVGEAPVEGYSNFSFVALAALAALLHFDQVFSLKIMGLVGLFFTCLFLYGISRLWLSCREALLPCVALLLYQGQILWAVSGLETSTYTACLTGAVYFSFRGLGYVPQSRLPTCSNRDCFLAGLFLACAGLTRPEAPVFMGLYLLLLCWDGHGLVKLRSGLLYFLLPLCCIYLPYFAWRWHYYGLVFPNPVYCKGRSSQFTGVLDTAYLALVWPFILCALPACLTSHDKRPYFLWLPSLVYLLLLWQADTVVAFDNRLFIPAFALLLPLAMKGLSDGLFYYFTEKDGYYYTCLYLCFAALAFLCIPAMSYSEYKQANINPLAGEALRGDVVTWLQAHATAQDTVLLGDSGLIPYALDLHFIDSYCLNNKAMAQLPAQQRYTLFCQDMLQKKPAIIILSALIKAGKVSYAPTDACLKPLLSTQETYTLAKVFSSDNVNSIYRYELFVRAQPEALEGNNA